eukprot:c8802_g1_i1.p1 GENE.c8802_g1_i1~~c8802_g1_i1.p1  ORF type:complete len:647 (+),score=100.79 c8802_g1_i1:242-1942(+)
MLTKCGGWVQKQIDVGKRACGTTSVQPIHTMPKLDKVFLEDDVDLEHISDVEKELPQNPIDEFDMADVLEWDSEDDALSMCSTFEHLKRGEKRKRSHEKAKIVVQPSLIQNLSLRTTTEAIMNLAELRLHSSQPVLIACDGKPGADAFHAKLKARAENPKSPRWSRIFVVLGPMHVKHKVLEYFTKTFRGLCNLDDFLDMVGRNSPGKRDFFCGLGDSRAVEDALFGLGLAHDLLLEKSFAECSKISPNLDFNNWRLELEHHCPTASMFAQIADIWGIVSLLDDCVRQQNFEMWLDTFQILGPLFVCNHNTNYIFLLFEYLQQYREASDVVRRLIGKSFSVSGFTMNIAVDTFVEKINKYYSGKLPNFTPGMAKKLHRASVQAQEHFTGLGTEAPDMRSDRLKRRAVYLKVAIIFLVKHGVVPECTSQPRPLPIPQKYFAPGDQMRKPLNTEWSKVVRSDSSMNTNFADDALKKYFEAYYSKNCRRKFDQHRSSLPSLPLTEAAFAAFRQRESTTVVEEVMNLYNLVDLRKEAKKFTHTELGMSSPSSANKLPLATAICRARKAIA